MKKYQSSIILCFILFCVVAGSNPLYALPAAINTLTNYQGSRIVTVQAHEVEWDDSYVVAVNDTAFTIGWGVNLNVGNSENELIASGLYVGFNIPLYIDADAGMAVLPVGQILDSREFLSSGRNRDDVHQYIYADKGGYIFGDDSEDYGDITGTLHDDGTIEFQEHFMFFIMDCVTHYHNNQIIGYDTTYYASPIFHDMTLRIPNGTHSFQRWSLTSQLLPYDVSSFVPSHSQIEQIARVSFPGICHPDGHGGLVPKPIDPRKPIALYLESDAAIDEGARDDSNDMTDFLDRLSMGGFDHLLELVQLQEPVAGTMGHGGRAVKPIDPRNPGKPLGLPDAPSVKNDNGRMFKSRIGSSPSSFSDSFVRNDYSVPVYIQQVDDTTVHVYNLFGMGYAASCMYIYGDGTMRFPGQLIAYDSEKHEDFYNFSYNGNAVVDGNVGTVITDQIAWEDATYLYSMSGIYTYHYQGNVLSFTNGEEFSLMDTTASTVDFFTIEDTVVSRGDVVDVPVVLTIAGDITAFHAYLQLPEGFELLGNVRLFNPGEGQTITVSALDDGSYRIDGNADSGLPFTAADGVVFYVTIKAPANADGEYRLHLRDNQLTTVAGDNVRCSNARGEITVLPYLMGDMDNDGKLDVLDVTKLISKILNSH